MTKQAITIVVLTVFSTVVSVAVANRFLHSKAPHAAIGEWENPHDWRRERQCIECHSRQDGFEPAKGADVLTPATTYHTEQFRRFTHGRAEFLSSSRCLSCHEQRSCNSCHEQAPESHTADFLCPRGHSPGLERHALLGRLRPSSCLVCHKSFTQDCTSCHQAGEVLQWQGQAKKVLNKWQNLSKSLPDHVDTVRK